MRLLTGSLVLCGVCWLSVPLGAQVESYRVGGDGLSWDSQAAVAGGVDLQNPALIRPIGLAETDNILRSLDWSDSPTLDFVTEGRAHIWDNAAIEGSAAVLVDGDDQTSSGDRFKGLGTDQTGRIFFLDLGASFPVNRLVYFPSPSFPDDFPRAFELSVNDGRDYTQQGEPRYQVLKRVDLQTESRTVIGFPVQLIRFIRLRILSPNPFEIAEIQAFGTGFVPKGTYLSQLIELPTAAILGALSVKATKLRRQPDGVLLPTATAAASVDLTLRNGTDETPLVHFEIVDRETGSEQPTTADAYAKLAEDFRGSILDDAENWTWKNPIRIDSTGTFTYPLELPGPRRYFDFQLFFWGTSTDLVQIDSLAISYSLPLADRAVGEVAVLADPFPPDGIVAVPAGRDTLFTYDIRAEFGSDAQVGFDGLHIATQTEPTLLKFEMGEPLVEVVPDSVHADAQGLMLYFPSNRVTPSNNQLLRVTFRTAILVYATDLVSHLIDSGGRLPQPVAAGDASSSVGTNTNRVFFSNAEGGGILSAMQVVPAVCTPNGDGVNEESRIVFQVLRLVQEVEFSIGIYDLAGRRVRQLFFDALSAGAYEHTWDGRDATGELVPPGAYIARIAAETESGEEVLARTLSVAY